MREMFLRRLATVEETHRLTNGPPQTIGINFVEGDGTPVIPTVAWTSNCDFECFRREGEDEREFRARAHAECRAFDRRPLQVLIFGDHD
jgi:hypothetical protein